VRTGFNIMGCLTFQEKLLLYRHYVFVLDLFHILYCQPVLGFTECEWIQFNWALVSIVTSTLSLIGSGFQASNNKRSPSSGFPNCSCNSVTATQRAKLLYTLYKSVQHMPNLTQDSTHALLILDTSNSRSTNLQQLTWHRPCREHRSPAT
jgi:hypothetical protein